MLEFGHFSMVNRIRCESKVGFNHLLESWSLSDWMTAAAGELGEAANIIKKLNRIRDDIPGNTKETTYESLNSELAKEIADTVIYLDLLAQRAGIDLGKAIKAKFNETSKKLNSPIEIT